MFCHSQQIFINFGTNSDIANILFNQLRNFISFKACVCIRHFSLLNVNAAGACGYDFPFDGGRLVRAYLRRRRGTI